MHPKILLPHARLLVEKYGAVVVAPEYRTAFEKPFPADLEDCYAALLFLKVHADELGINDAQIMVGGESAGGGLTVATCLLARDIGEVNIAFQMPLYPMLDDRETASSRDNHAPVWNTRTNRFAWKYYLRGLGGVTPPCYAAPAREANYAGLPPAYAYVGTEEPFYCETLEYVANLKRAGTEASVDVYQWGYTSTRRHRGFRRRIPPLVPCLRHAAPLREEVEGSRAAFRRALPLRHRALFRPAKNPSLSRLK